jgi:kynurenine formamidase
MIAQILHPTGNYKIDLSKPIDISITIRPNSNNVNAFYAPHPAAQPVISGSFVGSTEQGGAVNFFNLFINPHGNGTHTECVGHISKEKYVITDCLARHFYLCEVISITPMVLYNRDEVIYREQLKSHIKHYPTEALAIRTLPNDPLKRVAKYSGHNPAYLSAEAAAYLCDTGIEHLILDLPSVDRENDGGQLSAHKAFWRYPEYPRIQATITELVFIPQEVEDGLYFLDLQVAPIAMDAAPSRPVLYRII